MPNNPAKYDVLNNTCVQSWGQFNKEITLVIYKSDHCFYNCRRKRV